MAQPATRTGQTRSQTQRNTWWPFFCNQRTRINKAWRDDCTNSKTGGMSTKLGRQSQEIKPKFDQTFADQPPHPGSTWNQMCPKRPGTGIPAILDDLMEATPKKTPVSSPKKTPNHNEIFINSSHQLQTRKGRERKEEGCSTKRQTAVGGEERRDVNLVEAHRVFSTTQKMGIGSQQTTTFWFIPPP